MQPVNIVVNGQSNGKIAYSFPNLHRCSYFTPHVIMAVFIYLSIFVFLLIHISERVADLIRFRSHKIKC